MNSMSGVRTFESCCGHSKEPFSIWFVSKSVDAVRPLYEIIAPYKDWSIIVDRDFSRDFMFELRGPRGKAAYLSAEKIADDINRKVNGGGN